jgi:hypothetical protein
LYLRSSLEYNQKKGRMRNSRIAKIAVVGSSNTDMIINAAAAISVTRLGAQPSAPFRREIEDF